jgi:hypothetical protein
MGKKLILLLLGLILSSTALAALPTKPLHPVKNIAGNVPAAPSGLKAVFSGGWVSLNWIDNATDETGYRIERSVNGGPFALLTPMIKNTTGYDDVKLTPETNYTYRVNAVRNDLGNSAYSNTATATTPVDDGSYNTHVNAH